MGCAGSAALIGLSIEYENEWETAELALGWLASAGFCALLVVVLVIAWTRRVTGNLKPFGADLELGTGWAIGGFFTPIVMFWFPVRLWNQAWRATSPVLSPPIKRNYKLMSGRNLHWIAHLIWLSVAFISRLLADFATAFSAIEAGAYASIVGFGILISLLLFILLVRGLTARQDTYARIWAAASPAPPGG